MNQKDGDTFKKGVERAFVAALIFFGTGAYLAVQANSAKKQSAPQNEMACQSDEEQKQVSCFVSEDR